jgi:hypothetical protein
VQTHRTQLWTLKRVGVLIERQFGVKSGLNERPTHVRTWAPKGKTPIIQFHFNWTHISAIAGLTRTNCMFRLHEGSIKKEQHVEFLKEVRAHLKCKLVREYLDSTGGDVQMGVGSCRRTPVSAQQTHLPNGKKSCQCRGDFSTKNRILHESPRRSSHP